MSNCRIDEYIFLHKKWASDFSSCIQLCQDVAILINEKRPLHKDSSQFTQVDEMIQKDLLNLRANTEKLKINLLSSFESNNLLHGELERRRNLLDTLSTKVRILTKLHTTPQSCCNDEELNLYQRELLLKTSEDKLESHASSLSNCNPWLHYDENTDKHSTVNEDELTEFYEAQEKSLQDLSKSLLRQKEVATSIGQEAQHHNELLTGIKSATTPAVTHYMNGIDVQYTHPHISPAVIGLWSTSVLLAIAILVVSFIPLPQSPPI